ncbi:hypothetical protein OU798_18540 [Prolixibacteraceae bacterium Z1-6]|uniref:Uncharacterized protein n=1 Tax=Draconibacterium aestuarii TaxID=2998507 RepID=A0A9X3J683_9BACT|nr:hypothetical protein [Prolixibacteraceae bacterium Z1-6]
MNYETNPVRAHENFAIYKKSEEIFEVVQQIADLIPDKDNTPLSQIKAQMLEDAMMIQAKIAGAEGGDIYDIRMENAAIIRKAARDLMLTSHSLKIFGFKEVEYFDIVYGLLEDFRLLFIDWVAGFDQWNYIIDRWGLFNPPGIGPHDKDPNNDIPFDTDNSID